MMSNKDYVTVHCLGLADQPLALTARLQTQLSRLLEEHQSLLETVNQPEVKLLISSIHLVEKLFSPILILSCMVKVESRYQYRIIF